MNNGCPRCAAQLQQKEFGSVTVDGCAACGGIWFDANELNQLARDPSAGLMELERAFVPAVTGPDGAGDMQCPKCTQGLYDFSFTHSPGVKLFACPACRGVWSDEGAMQQMALRIAEGRPPAVVQPARQERLREQARMTAAFLMSAPCGACGVMNPAAALVCWACGHPLRTRNIMHLCPRCDRPMQELRPSGVPTTVDACLCCKGLFFHEGEMTVFLSAGFDEIQKVRATIGDGLGAYVEREVYEHRTVRCPGCHHGMNREPLGNSADVMIDTCSYCRGVWLDAGELVAAYRYFEAGGLPGTASRPADSWGSAD